MRILYVTIGYKPAYKLGGPVSSVSAAAERLIKRGHEVTVFTTNSNFDEDLDVPTDQPVNVDGVQVWYFRRREILKKMLPFIPYVSKSVGYFYAPKMSEALENIVPSMDIVHTHMPFIYPTKAAAKAAFRYSKPLVYSQRGVLDPNRLKFRALKKRLYLDLVEKPIMRKADLLIALTEGELQSYRTLGIDTECAIVPNGIDAAKFSNKTERTHLKPFGIEPHKLVILFLSRIHPIKGADKLLEAFISIANDFPEAVLVLAGPDEFGLESSFRESVKKAGLAERVFFPGLVTGDLKQDLLSRADLFVLPSVSEGFSMAVLEALASSTPVLISPGCYFPEIEAARAGRICDPEPTALATAMSQMLSDPQSLAEMGSAARSLALEKYCWDPIVAKLESLYIDVIEKRKKRFHFA